MAVEPDLPPARWLAGPRQSWAGAELGKVSAPQPGTLWAPGPSVRAVLASVCRCGCRGRPDSHFRQLAPREWSPWSEHERLPPCPTVQPEAQPSWPSAAPQLSSPWVPQLGLSGALLPSAALLAGQTSQRPTQVDSLPCFTDGFWQTVACVDGSGSLGVTLLTPWVWGAEGARRGLLCPDSSRS